MGGRGRRSRAAAEAEEKKGPLKRMPYVKPPFTIGDLKKSVPAHCFERSLAHSFSHVMHDLTIVFLLYYVAASYVHQLPSPYREVGWVVYWVLQGCVSTGVWVIGHECGHLAFSEYEWVDNTVGFVIHSLLLVPYFAWKYSHRRHHSNTGSLERDEAYIPKPRGKVKYLKYWNNPVGRVMIIVSTLIWGFPLYLGFHLNARQYDRLVSHFDPYSPMYNDRERLQVFISDAGILAALYILYRVALAKGLTWLVCIYGVPLLIVNGFVVLITFLQHTHPSLPRYDSSEWDWLRGALATVDRDFGVLNKVFHNVTDTHVAHHLFSTMPHYHAMEATEAIKPILGQYYQFDATPFYNAVWREAKECLFVEQDEGCPDNGVYWYRNKF